MIRALLVDDEERVLEIFGKNIHWKECEIDYLFTAESIEEALYYCDTYAPEIVITDIEMPDGSGLELIEQLKNKNVLSVFLCVTCHPEFEYMRKAMQLGCTDYILKPIEYEEMEQLLKNLVRRIKEQKLGKVNKTEIKEISLYEDDKLVLKVQDYIRSHLVENMSVQKIAEVHHCSVSHLMHSFKKKTEKTVVEYITNERMEKAKVLLKFSDFQINTVAEMSGYEDYSYFTRVFKKIVGYTPREYRNIYKNNIL